MAQTTTVNPRGRDGRFKKGGRRRARNANPRRRRRRRHNYGAAAANPRRRRRRHVVHHYAAARRRRRNPGGGGGVSPYSSGGYRRKPNPGMFDFDELMDVVPAATAGVIGSRWALKQSGAWEASKDGTLEPGLKQAIAIWIAAHLGDQLVTSVTGDHNKGAVARIAALGFGGDLFLRLRFGKDSTWLKDNVSLAGEEYGDAAELNGFQSQSALGAVWEDATGTRWTQDGSGNWVLAGMGQEGPLVQAADGTIYQLQGMGLDSMPGSGARLDGMGGFQSTSALGFARARSHSKSSFGYATGD